MYFFVGAGNGSCFQTTLDDLTLSSHFSLQGTWEIEQVDFDGNAFDTDRQVQLLKHVVRGRYTSVLTTVAARHIQCDSVIVSFLLALLRATARARAEGDWTRGFFVHIEDTRPAQRDGPSIWQLREVRELEDEGSVPVPCVSS